MKKKLLALAAVLAVTMACAIPAGCELNIGNGNDFNFYFTVSTNPTMYSTLNCFDDDAESFLIFARRGTVTQDGLPPNATIIQTSAVSNSENMLDVNTMYGKINSVLKKNRNANITFFVDDLNVEYFMDAVVRSQFLKMDNFKLVLLSDGTASYRIQTETDAIISASEIENPTTAQKDQIIKDAFDKAKADYEFMLNLHKQGGVSFLTYKNGDRTGNSYTHNGETKSGIKTLLGNLAVASGGQGFQVEYQLQFPQAYKSMYPAADYPLFNEILDSVNFKGFSFFEKFEKLTKAQQTSIVDGGLNAAFLGDVRQGYYTDDDGVIQSDISTTDREANKNTTAFNKTYLDSVFTAKDGKKNMMVMGTSNTTEGRGDTVAASENFVQTINEIVKRYGDDYNFFWKGHPSYPLSAEMTQFMYEKGFTILPYRISSTLLMWCYPEDLYLGGWDGSSWFDASIERSVFFTTYGDPVVKLIFDPYIKNQDNPDGTVEILGNPIPVS